MTDSLDEMLAGMVKPLQWTDRGTRDAVVEWSTAESMLGSYEIDSIRDEFQALGPGGLVSKGHRTTDAAKTAAQQDYARRVCAALNPDILRGMREAVIEECAKVADERAQQSHRKSAEENIRGHHIRGVSARSFLIWHHDVQADAATDLARALRSLSPKDTSNGK